MLQKTIAAVVTVFVLVTLGVVAHASVRPAPEYPRFYNPFPPCHVKNLVKVFDGLTPGTSTLEEVLERYGNPRYVVNNRYFYYRFHRSYRGYPDEQEVYIEFRKSRRLGKPRYRDGYELTAVISRIFVHSDYRMERLATYPDQIMDMTVYPYVAGYNARRGCYFLLFPYQGYGMYFSDDSGRFVGEIYFEPERYEIKSYFHFRAGSYDFRSLERDELPLYLP